MDIVLPHRWKARPYQVPLFDQMVQTGVRPGKKHGLLCWHRRAGKDLACLQYLIMEAFRRVGMYWHVFPTYRQGRTAIWEGMTHDLQRPMRFLDYFPEGTVIGRREDELTLWLINGSTYSIVGSDNVDRLVGANPVGVVYSEYSLQQVIARQYLTPILTVNGGWELVNFTPRGRNHAWELLKDARDQPDEWYVDLKDVTQTGVVTDEQIEKDRKNGIPEEIIQQEYYLSFDASLAGAYYSQQMARMLQEGRLRRVPTLENRPVRVAFDLGMSDATSLWFFQQDRELVRVLDYYHAFGQPIAHYSKEIQKRAQENNWTIGELLLPHDAKVREYSTAKTRLQTFQELGYRARAVPKLSLDDGIALVRSLLTRTVIDGEKCKVGVQGLREYRKKDTGLKDPQGNPIYDDKPVHDWCSHPADAFRTLAVGLRGEASGARSSGDRGPLYPEIAYV